MSQNRINILLEFLEVALHNVLYHRKLYPEEIFTKRKIYGISVHVSVHPELNEYIKGILISVKYLIEDNNNKLQSINLIYLNENKIPLEKFTFHLYQLQINAAENDTYFINPEEALRSLNLKLSVSENYLQPLPVNSSFIINIVTNHAAYFALTENSNCHFPWIIDDNLAELKNGFLLPIQNLETDYLFLLCYVVVNEKTKINIK